MQAQLTLQHGDGHPRETRLADKTPVSIGRHRRNDVVALDKYVSRDHALLRLIEGNWELHGLKTRNPTHLNGSRVPPMKWIPLHQGDTIRIGSTIWRFQLLDDDSISPPTPPQEIELPKDIPSGETPPTVPYAFSELSSLFNFVEELPQVENVQTLVEKALKAVYQLTNPLWAGFLSMDKTDGLPKLIYPETMIVDVELSHQLTTASKEKGRAVWLWEDGLPGSESLVSYMDAICVPVGVAGEPPFGALHVYRKGKNFVPRSLDLCKSVARSLARRMAQLRQERALRADNSRIQSRGAHQTNQLIGKSTALDKLREIIVRAGRAGNASVLIQGESGAGKELVALGVHRASDRAQEPFVPVNCGALGDLARSELFGHFKGAFTGALDDHEGYFEQADRGTLFLDEIGDLPRDLQVLLLRVLEDGIIPKLGAKKEPKCDVRVIAATHRDLEKEREEGRFRTDLYYRLCNFPVSVPPLRDHPEDIPDLSAHFLQIIAREYGQKHVPVLAPDVLPLLQQQPWKGNVRELRAVLSCAVAMAMGEDDEKEMVLSQDHFSLPDSPRRVTGSPADFPDTLNWEELKKWALLQALERTGGNQKAASELLDISQDAMADNMDKYGIPRPGRGKRK